MNKVEKAVAIACKAHEGQTDREGNAYILHPLTVGLMGDTDEEKAAGFLHDVLEDSSLTPEDLIAEGIPESIVTALKILCRDRSIDYFDYVQSIIDSGNPIALQVKYNDLQHNFARGKAYPDLQKKHGKALEMVRKAVEERSKVGLYRPVPGVSTAIFAGGCFWGVQHHFEKMDGVLRTLVGYTGSDEKSPSYAEVRNHLTRHVEAVIVEYDPETVSYEQLCRLFFEIHDPAQVDGVGPDLGPQYRSCVFYADQAQKKTAEQTMDLLRSKGYEVNTLLLPAVDFWIGEEYHQKYYEKTGGEPYCHVRERKF